MDLSSVHHHGCSMVANAGSQRAKERAGKQEDAREGATPLDTGPYDGQVVRRTVRRPPPPRATPYSARGVEGAIP